MWTPPENATLEECVVLMNEFYLELRKAGWTRHEALHIMLGQSTCCDEST